jgi:hypothetical protein
LAQERERERTFLRPASGMVARGVAAAAVRAEVHRW